jgi:[ribosomal protein S5]-alanine N-acetyltransferase
MLEVNFTPFPTIKTKRLVLRKIMPSDALDFLGVRANPSVTKYIDKEPPKSVDEATASIEFITKNLTENAGITWAVCLQENSALIGTVGFWRFVKEHYRAEIGYMLHPNFWRKGLTEESVIAAIDFGFKKLKLHSIQANINPGNVASEALLKKIHFVQEAYFKEDFFYRGKFLDSAIFSLLAPT